MERSITAGIQEPRNERTNEYMGMKDFMTCSDCRLPLPNHSMLPILRPPRDTGKSNVDNTVDGSHQIFTMLRLRSKARLQSAVCGSRWGRYQCTCSHIPGSRATTFCIILASSLPPLSLPAQVLLRGRPSLESAGFLLSV